MTKKLVAKIIAVITIISAASSPVSAACNDAKSITVGGMTSIQEIVSNNCNGNSNCNVNDIDGLRQKINELINKTKENGTCGKVTTVVTTKVTTKTTAKTTAKTTTKATTKTTAKITTKTTTKTTAKTTAKTTTKITTKATTKTTVKTTAKPATQTTTKTTTKAPVTTTKPSANTSETEYVNEVLRLVNVERAKEGLSALTLNKTACEAANVRSKEIVNTFSHTRPNGSSCFTALNEAGVKYKTAGENIASGYNTPADVVKGWMNSQGHRENIMNGKFTEIGIGYYYNASTTYRSYWTQLFIG